MLIAHTAWRSSGIFQAAFNRAESMTEGANRWWDQAGESVAPSAPSSLDQAGEAAGRLALKTEAEAPRAASAGESFWKDADDAGGELAPFIASFRQVNDVDVDTDPNANFTTDLRETDSDRNSNSNTNRLGGPPTKTSATGIEIGGRGKQKFGKNAAAAEITEGDDVSLAGGDRVQSENKKPRRRGELEAEELARIAAKTEALARLQLLDRKDGTEEGIRRGSSGGVPSC